MHLSSKVLSVISVLESAVPKVVEAVVDDDIDWRLLAGVGEGCSACVDRCILECVCVYMATGCWLTHRCASPCKGMQNCTTACLALLLVFSTD